MVTIKDVANRAGVSITTVSRVMNDRGPLSEATKKAVHDAMEELGYFPNDVARALGKNSLNIIGLIVPSLKHPFFGEMVHEFEYYCYSRGFKLMVFASFYDVEKEKNCVSLMRRNMVDCIVYASHSQGSDFLEDLKIPAVTLENVFPGIPAILSNNMQGGTMASRHLIAKGCRKLINISGQRDLRLSADERTDAFIKECQCKGVEYKIYSADEKMLKDLDYTDLISRIFYEQQDMDGIFASSDIIAAQCIQTALSMGYRIPEDLKIVGYDDISLSRLIYPPLTTVRQNVKELVRTAMDTIMAIIDSKEVPQRQILPVTFIERKTT